MGLQTFIASLQIVKCVVRADVAEADVFHLVGLSDRHERKIDPVGCPRFDVTV